jgi:hypothetical protein
LPTGSRGTGTWYRSSQPPRTLSRTANSSDGRMTSRASSATA